VDGVYSDACSADTGINYSEAFRDPLRLLVAGVMGKVERICVDCAGIRTPGMGSWAWRYRWLLLVASPLT
jgi:hypothetical protein